MKEGDEKNDANKGTGSEELEILDEVEESLEEGEYNKDEKDGADTGDAEANPIGRD